jgi:hypothetical protein
VAALAGTNVLGHRVDEAAAVIAVGMTVLGACSIPWRQQGQRAGGRLVVRIRQHVLLPTHGFIVAALGGAGWLAVAWMSAPVPGH